jgi:DNA-binding NarL/FixJ family response regulator
MVGEGRRRVVAWEAALCGRAYVEARTHRDPTRSVAGPRIVTVMDGPRVRTFDVVLATVVAAALVVVTPVIDREREVLALVGGGLSNQEIAAELFISVATARTHVSRAMTKLHKRDRAQLVVAAYESGLVTPGQR